MRSNVACSGTSTQCNELAVPVTDLPEQLLKREHQCPRYDARLCGDPVVQHQLNETSSLCLLPCVCTVKRILRQLVEEQRESLDRLL